MNKTLTTYKLLSLGLPQARRLLSEENLAAAAQSLDNSIKQVVEFNRKALSVNGLSTILIGSPARLSSFFKPSSKISHKIKEKISSAISDQYKINAKMKNHSNNNVDPSPQTTMTRRSR
jgi:hypothetical protein